MWAGHLPYGNSCLPGLNFALFFTNLNTGHRIKWVPSPGWGNLFPPGTMAGNDLSVINAFN